MGVHRKYPADHTLEMRSSQSSPILNLIVEKFPGYDRNKMKILNPV